MIKVEDHGREFYVDYDLTIYTLKKTKPTLTKCRGGYITLQSSKKGKRKTHLAHRLIAKAFIPNPQNFPCINHKDGNKSNYNVSNLEWCTMSQNILHYKKNFQKQYIDERNQKRTAAIKALLELGWSKQDLDILFPRLKHKWHKTIL